MALGWKILPQDTHISRCGVLLNTPQCPGAPTPETVTSWVHGAGSPLYLHLQLYASLTGTEKDRKVIGGRLHPRPHSVNTRARSQIPLETEKLGGMGTAVP